jgi:chromosome segregation ATPase
MAGLIALDEDSILQSLQNKLIGGQRTGRADREQERRELEQQLYTLETQVEQLYEDKVSGVVSADTFSELAGKAEAERLEIEDRLSLLTQTTEQADSKLADIERWISLIKEKSTFDEVDRDLLESIIDRIEVSEKKVIDGVKTQDVKIYYKYVGLC